MAHAGRLSQRIERLLNENSFRQAFAGGRRRICGGPAAGSGVLFAATALIRVEAAQTPAATGERAMAPVAGQSHPEMRTGRPAPEQSHRHAARGPVPGSVVEARPPRPPAPARRPERRQPRRPLAPPSAVSPQTPPTPIAADRTRTRTDRYRHQARRADRPAPAMDDSRSIPVSSLHGYSYAYSSNGDSYAVVSGNDKAPRQLLGRLA